MIKLQYKKYCNFIIYIVQWRIIKLKIYRERKLKIQEVEKSLKRFLKKKGSFSAALLVMFLITGTISLGGVESVTEINGIKENILVKIKQEREKIKAKIKENESKISEETAMFDTLVKEWDFYGKPLGQNTQVFFTYNKINSGSLKDRTGEAFKKTIDAGIASGLSGGATLDKIIQNSGMIVDGTTFSEKIEIPVNIVPLVPEIPVVNKDINVNINTPQIGDIPALGIPVFNIPDVIVVNKVVVGAVNVQNFGGATINPPTTVIPIEIVGLTPPEIVLPDEKTINIGAPTAPSGFEPTQIEPPKVPSIPVIATIEVPDFKTNVTSSGNFTNTYVLLGVDDASSYRNAIIESVSITEGEFKIQRYGNKRWNFEFKDYGGVNVFSSSPNSDALFYKTGEPVVKYKTGAYWQGLNDEININEKLGFQSLIGDSRASSTMLSNANFLYTNTKDSSFLNEFAHLDMHGASPVLKERERLVKGTTNEDGTRLENYEAIEAAFDDAVQINPENSNSTKDSDIYTWINSGKIVLEGGNGSISNHYEHDKSPVNASTNKAMVINTGDIFIVPYEGKKYIPPSPSGGTATWGEGKKDSNNGVFIMSLDSPKSTHHVMYNSGTIESYTLNSFVFLSSTKLGKGPLSNSPFTTAYRPLSIVNRGEIKIMGENSTGVYIKTGSKNQYEFTTKDFDLATGIGSYNPIEIYGDKSIGLYIESTGSATLEKPGAVEVSVPVYNKGNFAVDIGSENVGNQVFNTLQHTIDGVTSDYTAGDKITDLNVNPNGTSTNIEGSFGILSNSNLDLDSHQIRIYNKTESSVAVTPMSDAVLNLGKGSIELNGGSNNIGLYISGTGTNTGKIITEGTVKLIGGNSNIAAYTSGAGNNITVETIDGANLTDSIFLFAANGSEIGVTNGISITSKVSVDANSTNEKDSGAAFASGAGSKIVINRDELEATANITITGAKQTDTSNQLGFGLMAIDGGKIEAKNNNIEVIKGSTGIGSIGLGSHVDFTGGRLKYDGNSYAVYSDGKGKIDLSEATLELWGNSTAFDLDLSGGAISPIILNDKSRIEVKSNDIIVFTLKNATALDTSGLEISILNSIGGALSGSIDLTKLIEAGEGIDKYKTAAVDGGTIIVGNLDRTGTGATGETPDQKDGNFYYNRFLGQRLVATATGSKISAVLTSVEAEKYKDQVVGFEMNSSTLAVDNTETAINLVGSTVIADRTDLGAGAMGLFINYGKVSVDGTSKIEVEKGSNTVNDGGVGIYSVNGSGVTVATGGKIDVAGDGAFGILGMAYRKDATGNPIVNEFTTTANPNITQGQVNISNSGTITLNGIGSIGIYADNNNVLGGITDSNISNLSSGKITVGGGNSQTTSVGMYGKKSTISNLGTIEAGDGGVGIYGIEGSEIKDLGTINLGSDGIGVVVDETSKITATSLVLGEIAGSPIDENGKVGIMYKGTIGAAQQSISVSINSVGIDKATGIYVENANVITNGDLHIGSNGVGVYSKNGIVVNNAGKALGTVGIQLGNNAGAMGMYLQTDETATGSITNEGKIIVGEKTQFAMLGTGSGSTIINNGDIELTVAESIGIYAQDGATVNFAGQGIEFTPGETGSIGVFVSNATANIELGTDIFESKNKDGNILIYGEKGSIVTNTKGLVVDGIALDATGNGKKIGIYLNGDETVNNYISTSGTGKLEIRNGAIGLYSKGDNMLDFTGGLHASGAETTGIYIDGKATLTGTLESDNGAIGVYGKGGEITLNGTTTVKIGATTNSIGFYLEDGASLIGNLNITGGNDGIGTYYSRSVLSTGDMTVFNTGNITITNTGTDNVVGIYVSGATSTNTSTLTNSGTVIGTGNNVIATMTKDGTLNINGLITVSGKDSVGAFAAQGGIITNNSIITATNTSILGTDMTIGMIAQSGIAGETATIVNNKIIIAEGTNDVGMYLGSTAGINTGKNIVDATINVKDGIAVYVKGLKNKFVNSGTLKVTGSGIGIYLEGSGNGTISNTGKIDLSSEAKGVYSKDSIIDFDITTTGAAKGIGIYATGTTTFVSSTIDVANGQIGIYTDDTAVDLSGAIVEAKDKVGTDSSIGIYLKDNAVAYTMVGTKVTVGNGVGIYLGNNEGTVSALQGTTLTFSGTVSTVGGIGIYVPEASTLNTGEVTLNVNGGTGVYLGGGTANLGVTDTLKIKLTGDNATGIYIESGTLTLGEKIEVKGEGTIATTVNGTIKSDAPLNVGKNSQGLLGGYYGPDSQLNIYSIENGLAGIINIKEGGIGLVAIDSSKSNDPTKILTTASITIINSGTLNVDGYIMNDTLTGKVKVDSIGIYSEVAEVQNIGKIAVTGEGGIGIFYNGKTVDAKDITSNNIELNGSNGIGIYATGNMGAIKNTIIKTDSTGSNNTGILLVGATTSPLTPPTTVVSSLDVGRITLGKESIGLMVKDISVTTTTTGGVITIGNGTKDKVSVGVYLDNSTIGALSSVSMGEYGVAYSMKNGSEATIDFTNTSIGTNGVYLNAVSGSKATVSGTLDVGAGSTGIHSENGELIFNSPTTITVSAGGIGLIVKNSVVTATSGNIPTITVNTGSEGNYSIGSYYDTVNSSLVLSDISTTTQMGNYTISHVLDKANATIGSMVLGAPALAGTFGNNQIGVMLKTGSTLVAGTIGTTGTTIDITGGDNNIGIYASSGTVANNVTVHGNINVGDSSEFAKSSIGVYVKNGTYTGNSGTLTVGANSIGIYGKQLTGTLSQGAIKVGDSAIGIHALSDSTGLTINQTGGLDVGNAGSIGIYGTDVDNGVVSGGRTDINVSGGTADKVGTGTSIGILSQGAGTVDYSGTMDIADSTGSGSIGIYKDGIGTITVGSSAVGSTDKLIVGNAGYGIYSINGTTTLSSNITNYADMTLGDASIGIYSKGQGTVNNYGNINVGTTNVSTPKTPINSIGIYSSGGKIVNHLGATITVDESHSIGIYADNGGTITNDGIIDVSGGGIGIFAYGEGTNVINNGDINVVGTDDSGWKSIGISIAKGASVINNGTIIVNGGYGIHVGEGGKIINAGVIKVDNGGVDITDGNDLIASVGGVVIKPNGDVIINENYVGIGGSLDASGADINLDGAWIEATTTTGKPIFIGNTVSGEITLLPGFISREPVTTIENFFNSFVGVNMVNGITVGTSPRFVAKKVGNDLVIATRPYADLSIGDQFDELENGLDYLKEHGNTNDSDIIVNLDKYLNGFRGDEFAEETGKAIAETRGDIYGTIQGRMQDVNRAFDNSFDELLNSYNPSRQSDKFSVLYTEGDFKDPTLGISDYDYDVKGLLYMHEKDGLKYGTKYGYTLGFTGATFKFDDDTAGSSGSEEDIYSLRVGAHREQKLGTSKFTWLTRGELAYNYHDTERNMQLGPEKYDNKAGYSSYGASFKNELSYTAYSTLSTDLKVYGGANLEYGAMEGFTEKTGSKGGLELEVKGNDYFIGELEAGLKGSKKIYLGKNINLKVSADAGYAYDLGDNYPGNKAKLKNGGEGYYDLITTEKAEGSLRGKVGLGLEKANHYGVTFEVEWNKRDNRSDEDIKYSARLNYKF